MTTVINDRLLFIHIPKTGGTWVSDAMTAAGVEVEEVVGVPNLPHPELTDLPRRDFTFAFVREPLSWYRSVWRFHRKQPLDGWATIGQWVGLDFPEFLGRIATKRPGYLKRYYQLFVGSPGDEIDFIGRFERLSEDLATALRLAGENFDETKLKAMPARNYEGEVDMYGALHPPKPPPLECPAEIEASIIEAESYLYERFYGGVDAYLRAIVATGENESVRA